MKTTLTTLLNIILLENLSRERKVGGAKEGATRTRGRTRDGILGSPTPAYSAQDSLPKENDSVPNVNSAEAENLWTQSRHGSSLNVLGLEFEGG